MIQIAICDDEVTTLHQIKRLLKEYPKVEFAIDEFLDGETLLSSRQSYEILLLDIDMKGISGIEAARQLRLRDKKVKIIYITNYSDYTSFAFAVHAFAYLLKPVKPEELYKQLDEAFEYMQVPRKSILEFNTTEGIIRIDSTEILYFEYLNHKVSLKTVHRAYLIKCSITDVASGLSEDGFAIPHKSFVVNLYHVKNIRGYDIYLTDDTLIPLSQKKSAQFRRELNHYLSDGRRSNPLCNL